MKLKTTGYFQEKENERKSKRMKTKTRVETNKRNQRTNLPKMRNETLTRPYCKKIQKLETRRVKKALVKRSER